MALKIRLRRMGRKKAPTYRIVVAESSMPRDGRFVASIGHYNPRTEPMTITVDREKALYWIDQGAVPTDTTRSLLKRAGVFGPAPVVTEEEAGGVQAAARQAASAVASAAEAVQEAASGAVEAVQEAASGAAEAVRERLGGEEQAEEAAEPAGTEGDAPAADEEKAAPQGE